MALTKEQILEARREVGLDRLQGKSQTSTAEARPNSERRQRLDALLERNKSNSAVELYNSKYAKPSQKVEKKSGSFFSKLGNFGKSIVRPLAEVGTTAVNFGESIYDLARGDQAGADEALRKSRNIPLLGETKPAFTPEEVDTFSGFTKEVVGTGLDVGSTVIGGAGATGVVKSGLKGAIKRGAIEGAKTGFASGFASQAGQSLKEDESVVESVGKGLVGGAFGAAIGGVLGGATGAVLNPRKITNTTKEIPFKVQKKLSGLDDKEVSTIEKSLKAKVDGINKNISAGKIDYEKGQELLGKATAEKAEKALSVGKKFDEYLDYAQKSKTDFNIPSALGKAGQKAEEVLESIGKLKQTVGEEKGNLLSGIADRTVDGIDAVKTRFDTIVADRMGAAISKVDDNLNVSSLPGRISRISIDPAEKRILVQTKNILDELGDADNLIKVDDAIDALQAIVESEKALQSIPRITKAEGIVKAIIADLQKRLGDVGGKEYRLVNKKYSTLIRVYDALNKKLQYDPKLGTSRGDALLKQVFSPSGNTIRGLLKRIEELTGENLIDDAVLARFAMKMVGDHRADSLLENTAQGMVNGSNVKKSIMQSIWNKVGDVVSNPEEVGKKMLRKKGVPIK